MLINFFGMVYLVGMMSGVYKAKPSLKACSRCEFADICPSSALLKREDKTEIRNRETWILEHLEEKRISKGDRKD